MIIHLCLLGLFIFATAAHGNTTIPSLLSERTGFLLLVHDVSHFRAHISETPLGRLWTTPPADEAERSGLLAFRIQRETGLSLPAMLDRFEDEAALVVPELNSLVGPPEDKENWALVALTENDAPWQRLGKDLESANKKRGKARTVKMAGLSVRLFVSGKNDSTLAWTWWQGTGFLASSPRVLRNMIDARKQASHLDQTDNWRTLAGKTPEGDLTIYANLEGLASLVSQRAPGGEADSLGAMIGIMPSTVMKALGLGAFRAARMTVTLHADEAQLDGGLIVRDEPGLARILAYQPGPIERGSFIPSDAILVHASRFRLADFWNACLETMDQVSPGVSYFARAQMTQMVEASGLDFEEDVLGNFEDDSFIIYLPTSEAPSDSVPWDPDQLSGVRIKDAAKAQKTMAAIANWTSSIGADDEGAPVKHDTPGKTKSIRGVDVTFLDYGKFGKFGAPQTPRTLSYAIVDSVLLVAMGGEDIMERVLEARARGESFWKRPDLAPLLASVPRDAASVSYWEPAALRKQIESSSKLKDESRQVVKMLLMELGPSIAYTLKTPEGYFTRVRLRRAFP